MKVDKYFEFVQADFEPVKSFHLKDELNPKLWTDFEIDEEIREDLLRIAQDFYIGTNINADVKDVVLCGSLANYNWSEKYSDFDIHIIIDYMEVDENYDLVESLCDFAKKVWNKLHEITISKYEVEVAIQNLSDLKNDIKVGKMGGVFSLMDNKWLKKPEKKDFEPDEEQIREKAENIMFAIDDLEKQVDEDKWEYFEEKIDKVWKKIKNYRKSGLDSEDGEFSIGNLVFKLLRRNGYIEKVMKIKRYAYDKQFE
jgi:hypothetical protein